MQYAILISAPKNTYTIFLHTSMLTHQTAPPHTQDTVHYQWRGGASPHPALTPHGHSCGSEKLSVVLARDVESPVTWASFHSHMITLPRSHDQSNLSTPRDTLKLQPVLTWHHGVRVLAHCAVPPADVSGQRTLSGYFLSEHPGGLQ